MTEDEKKAINNLNFIIVTDVYDNEVRINKTEVVNEYNESVGIVLNLIQKQDTEINKLNVENIKLNNVIDRMAEVLSDFDFDKQCEDCRCDYCNAVEDTDEYMKCIKEYFMKDNEVE